MAGKNIAILIASEYSDFQAHYLTSYLSEYGAKVEFLMVDWITWKFTRPNNQQKGVQGMWGYDVRKPTLRRTVMSLREINDPQRYHALIVLGGHSADVMVADKEVITFISDSPYTLNGNTPTHLQSYNIKISSRLQQFSGCSSEFSCKKRTFSRENSCKQSRSAPICGRNYAANAELVTTEAVESFGVVSGVPQSEKAAESNSNRQIYSSEENLTIVHRSNNAEYMFAPYAYAGC